MKKTFTFCSIITLCLMLFSFAGFAQINTNGGFESWTGTSPDGWMGSKSNITASNVVQVTTGAHTGNYACQLINTANGHKRFTTQGIAVNNGTQYVISFWVKGKGEIRVALFDDRETGSGYSPYSAYHNINSTTYQYCEDTLTAANTLASGEFILSLRSTDADFDHLIVDDVTITAVTEEGFVAEPVAIVTGTQQSTDTYLGSATVSLSCITTGASIYYTLDGTEPTASSTLYSAPINITTTTTLKAIAMQNGYSSTVFTKDITIINVTPLFYEDFETGSLNQMTATNVSGTHSWVSASYGDDHYAQANAYNQGACETWLITPAITPLNAGGVIMSFASATKFTGPAIQVKYSTNYSGSGSPATATWTDITDEFVLSTGNNWNWTFSGEYEMPGATPVYFAWVYTSEESSAAGWRIDNIVVLPGESPVPTPTLTINEPVNGAVYSTLDTLHVGIDIQNFTLDTDGYLKIESNFLESFLGMDVIYLDQTMMNIIPMFPLSPLPAGEFYFTASLVGLDSNALTPPVSVSASFSVVAPMLDTPVFTPVAGTYADSVTVSIACATEGAEIYYTTDGTEPTEASTLYSAPISLTATTTVKAKAFKTSWLASETATATYTIVFDPVLTVDVNTLNFTSTQLTQTFTVSGAHLENPITMSCDNTHFTLSPATITTPNNNTVVTVTFDGAEPATGTISVTSDTLSAQVALAATAQLPAPVITPATGEDTLITVTMSCTVTGAEIHYTNDGTEPTSASATYTAPIVLITPGAYTLKAIAMKADWENSEVTTGTFTVIEPSVGDTVVYSVGFEAEEGFAASNVYNNTTVAFTGPDGAQWGTYYGTPSTNNHITGAQSMQMRWYTSASENIAYTFTNFDLNNVTHVTFAAASSNGLNVNVSHSVDGGNTFSAGQVFTLGSTASTFDYVVDETGSYDFVRLKFTIVLPETNPTSTSRVVIDSLVVFGIPGVAPTTVNAPVITPNDGFYYEPQTVSITCSDADAVIRYTTDGSVPTENSTIYTAPFTVNTTTTIKAKAWKTGMAPSFVTTVNISFPEQVANIAAFKSNASSSAQQIMSDVTFVFRSGHYMFVEDNSAALLIYDNSGVITTTYNEGDVIEAGLFGSYQLYGGMVELIPSHNANAATGTPVTVTPTVATVSNIINDYATVYESKLVRLNNVQFIDATTFVQNGDTMSIRDRFNTLTVTINAGDNADVVGFVSYSTQYGYQIYPRDDNDIIINTLETVATPEFFFQRDGEFYRMTLTCATEGASMYYTIDGSDPDESGYEYNDAVPFYLNVHYVIKAIAMKEGMLNSEIAVYDYDPTGLPSIDMDDFLIAYPNPASDRVFVHFESKSVNIEKVELYNAYGQLVKVVDVNSSVAEVSVSTLASGTYFAKVFTELGIAKMPIIRK